MNNPTSVSFKHVAGFLNPLLTRKIPSLLITHAARVNAMSPFLLWETIAQEKRVQPQSLLTNKKYRRGFREEVITLGQEAPSSISSRSPIIP